MAMSDIGLGLLGAGPWGRRYIETIKALDGVRVAALGTRNTESARLVDGDCRIFADWREVIQAPDVQAIIVATPPQLHADMALAAIEAGRPVLIEKPLTMSLPDARMIAHKSRDQNVLAMVGHTQLFNAAFRKMKRLLPSIGPVRRLIVNSGNWGPFRADVSALWDYAPHDVSMCIDLLEACPAKISARRHAHEEMYGGHGDRYQLTLGFARGITAEIRGGNLLKPKRRRLEVYGESGALVFDDLAPDKLVRRVRDADVAIAHDSELPLTTQVREFASAVRFGHTRDPSLQLACEVVEVLARCERCLAGDDAPNVAGLYAIPTAAASTAPAAPLRSCLSPS
jgi:predicted dehydrogenase